MNEKEMNPELLAFAPYKAALQKLDETSQARDKAETHLERLRAGHPPVPSLTARATAYLTGNKDALAVATATAEQIEAAVDDLDVVTEAVRLCQEDVARQRKLAVAAALTARLPKHRHLVVAVATALTHAVSVIDAEREFFSECERLSGGNSSPIQSIQPQVPAVLRLRHVAAEFGPIADRYANG